MRAALLLLLLTAACSNDVVTCDTVTADVGDICLPDTFAPDIGAVIELRELCGKGCSGAPSCRALFTNGRVALDVQQEVCSDTQTSSCIDLGCQTRLMRCALPPLPAGRYTMTVPGGVTRLLTVAPGGQASCLFPNADGGVQ